MKIRVSLELTPDEIDRLITHASIRGFALENFKKSWKEKDRHEAVRFLVNKLVKEKT